MSGRMDRDKSQSKALALEPIEPPASKSDAEGDPGASAPVPVDEEPKGPDKFLATAIREYAKGRVNQRLWASIAAKTGGDEKTTRSAYLVARATELRLALREQSSQARGNEAALPKPELVQIEGGTRTRTTPSVPAGRDRKRVYIGVGAALIAFIVAGAVALMRAGGDDPKSTSAMATMAPKSGKAAAAARKEPEKPAEPAPRENMEAKIRGFAEAGNWNMLVIFAIEWTRMEPSSVAAWVELSRGYTKMGQFDDAVRAAKKSVELAPQDPALWRNLAHIEAAANNAEGAVHAYEQVTVLDPKDVDSLVQIGIVHVKSDRMPQAKAAFDRVLAADPANVDALCGEQFAAQRDNRTKDAEALAKQLRAIDGKCRDIGDGATVAVKHPGAVRTTGR